MQKSLVLTPKTPRKALGLKSCLNQFRKHTKRPEVFLKLQTQLSNDLKSLLKAVYDHGAKTGYNVSSDAPYLEELVTEQMDEEQIWQQLELKNEHFVDQDLKKMSELLSKGEKALTLNFSTETESDYGSEEEEPSACEGGEESPEENGENGHERESGSDEENDGGAQKKAKKQKKKKKSKPYDETKRSVVDDRFFKLDDMARFLDEEDERERRRQKGLGDKNPLIEIDYFDEHTGEDDGDYAAGMKYSDFFEDEDDEEDDGDDDDDDDDDDGGREDSGDEEENEESETEKLHDDEQDVSGMEEDQDEAGGVAQKEEEELSDEALVERNRRLRFEIYKTDGGITDMAPPEPLAKKVTFEQPETSDNEDDGEKSKSDGTKSSFELRQEKLHNKIAKMEQQLLKEKPWQLKGEISAETRPQNSLLEEVLEFENTTRPVPVITEETTMKLEDIIKQRIRNKAFDDVERKVRPPDNPREYRKQLVLDGEKSKESLAQVYEQDYLKQLEKTNPDAADQPQEEPAEHKEIRRMMKTLMAQLDALSNYHYTPRPAVPELKIITNTPAISMEEVAPVAVSDANLLAPEEVKNRPKGDVMSKEERTKTDQNRERRLKKRFQQQKYRREAEREQKQLEKAGGSSSKQNRALQSSLLKKVTQAKNVQQMTETTGPSKSSTAFFSKLQDEVRSQVKATAKGGDKKKKNANNLQATSLKL